MKVYRQRANHVLPFEIQPSLQEGISVESWESRTYYICDCVSFRALEIRWELFILTKILQIFFQNIQANAGKTRYSKFEFGLWYARSL
jgi:hypothetical protein